VRKKAFRRILKLKKRLKKKRNNESREKTSKILVDINESLSNDCKWLTDAIEKSMVFDSIKDISELYTGLNRIKIFWGIH